MADHLGRTVFPVIGPPGAGKSTALIALEQHLPHLGRFGVRDYGLALAAAGEPLGLMMRDTLLRQELLSNTLVRQGFLHFMDRLPPPVRVIAVEGYPRDEQQCEDLIRATQSRGATVGAFIIVDVPDDLVRERVIRRRICVRCGAPTGELARTRCATCGGALTRRRDDGVARLERRLADYHAMVSALRGYPAVRRRLQVVDGQLPPERVRESLAGLLGPGSVARVQG